MTFARPGGPHPQTKWSFLARLLLGKPLSQQSTSYIPIAQIRIFASTLICRESATEELIDKRLITTTLSERYTLANY